MIGPRPLTPTGLTLLFDAYSAPTFDAPWQPGAVDVLNPRGEVLGGIARSSWFSAPRIAQLLYDDGRGATAPPTDASAPAAAVDRVRRWHRFVDVEIAPGLRIRAVEAIVALEFASISTDFRMMEMVAHLHADEHLDSAGVVTALYPLLRVREKRETFLAALALELGGDIRFTRLNDQNVSEDERFTQHGRRIYSVVLDRELERPADSGDDYVQPEQLPRRDLALRARERATLNTRSARPLADGKADTAHTDLLELSGDWSAMVLRDGAAFVMHPGGRFAEAALHTSTIYTDALALARLQARIVDELAIAAGERVYSRREISIDVVRPLESDVARFRASYSATSTSLPGRARELIGAMQKQLEFQTALDGLSLEVKGMSNLAQQHAALLAERASVLAQEAARVAEQSAAVAARSSATLNAVLGFLSIFGFPISIGVALWETLDGTWTYLAVYLLVSVAVGLGLYAAVLAFMRRHGPRRPPSTSRLRRADRSRA
jgi:hypothetical protein